MFALLFGVVSLLYATVGQAGGTAFLALMALASYPSNEMRPTALLLNIVARNIFDLAFQSRKFGGLGKNSGRSCSLPFRPLLSAALSSWTIASTKSSPD
ncbi:MAG: hypothetical protein WDN50_10230 [Bradyrhizobium sp.]